MRSTIIEKSGLRAASEDKLLQWSMLSGYQCAGCGEWNETAVDESAGSSQSYVEDCQVCCRPNVLRVTYDRDAGEFVVGAELE